MSTHYHTCTLCEATCGITVEVADGRIGTIRGDSDDPFSRGHICPKAAALADLHGDADRLRRPLRRQASTWVEIGWEEAFDEVAARLAEVRARHGKHAIGVYQGNPTVHSLGLMTFGQLLSRQIRTRNHFSATSVDQLPHMLASLLMLGHQLLLPVPDVDRTDLLVVLGANPLVSNGSLMTAPDMRGRLRALKARGGKLVVIDPRRTETAAVADQHLFIKPGTDALLLLALIHTVFAESLARVGRLAGFTDGVETVRAVAADFAPEAVAAHVGIGAAEIRSLARLLATTARAVCYGRLGVCVQEYGGLAAWLINVLNIVTGHFDEPGGAMFTTPAADLVALSAHIGARGSYGRYRSRVRGLPEFGGELPVVTMAEEIDTPGPDQIRAMVVSAGNPVLSTPNGARLERALATLEFMVSVDFYLNETSRHAHIILPPTSPLERSHYDLAFNVLAVRNIARYVPGVVERAPDERHDWEIALELATRLGARKGMGGSLIARALRMAGRRLGPEALLDLALRTGPYGMGKQGLSLRMLKKHPHGMDLGPLEPRLPERLFTPAKRIELAPQPMMDDLGRLRDLVRGGMPDTMPDQRLDQRFDKAHDRAGTAAGAASGDGDEQHQGPSDSQASPLSLIGRRQLRNNNSWLHNSQRLMKGKTRCTLLINPADARARNIAAGALVEVSSRVGQVVVPVEISADIMPGVVSLPHGFGHTRDGVRLRIAAEHAGASINDVTDEARFDPFSGTASLSGVPVTVVPAGTPAGVLTAKTDMAAAPEPAGAAAGETL